MSKVRFRIDFRECEHDGDLDNYIYDIVESGGTVINKQIDYDEETAWVIVEADNKDDFFEKFEHTNAYDFTN